MGTQNYRDEYRAAFHQANSDLVGIYDEYERLQIRKEQIEDVLVALEPFLQHLNAQIELIRQSAPVAIVPREEESPAEPELQFNLETSALAVPTAIKTDMDPIQRRINSALGLAVA